MKKRNGESEKMEPLAPFEELSKIASTLILVAVFLAILMGAMDSLVVATVLPTIAKDLHQVNGVTFVSGAYLISSTISIPIFARLSDIAGRRNVFLAGLTIFIAGSALAGLSQNLTELIVFRGMQGVGGGGIFPVALAMIAVLFPPKTRARVIGIMSGASGLSIVLGPLVGSYIVSITTWRWVFYINLPFGIMAFVVLLFAIGPLRPPTIGRFDIPGAGLLSGWVAALMIALVDVSDEGLSWANPLIVALLAGSATMLVLFLYWELRSKEPLVPLHLFRQRVVAASSGTMFFTGLVLSALFTFLSVFVGIVLLKSGPNATSDVRDIIYFSALPMILGAAISGQVLTKVSYRGVIAPALALAVFSSFFLTELTSSTHLWILVDGFLPVGGIALPLIPLGFGLGFTLAVPTVAVQNEVTKGEVGAAIGLTRFLQSLGGAMGISVLTVFEIGRFKTLSAGATSPAAVTNALVSSYDEVFMILALCLVITFVFSLFFVGRIRQRVVEDPSPVSKEEGSQPPQHKDD